jgi:hypothetical protein
MSEQRRYFSKNQPGYRIDKARLQVNIKRYRVDMATNRELTQYRSKVQISWGIARTHQRGRRHQLFEWRIQDSPRSGRTYQGTAKGVAANAKLSLDTYHRPLRRYEQDSGETQRFRTHQTAERHAETKLQLKDTSLVLQVVRECFKVV